MYYMFDKQLIILRRRLISIAYGKKYVDYQHSKCISISNSGLNKKLKADSKKNQPLAFYLVSFF